jgi:hypothetical protein
MLRLYCFSLFISTNVFIILLKSIYFETAYGSINNAQIRLCVGEEGPSRLKYALETAKMAKEARMSILLVLFHSDKWADLYKQPAPEIWTNLNFDQKKVIEDYARKVLAQYLSMSIHILVLFLEDNFGS